MGVSERLGEIELKQEMSKKIFFKLNKEIRKIQNFINKYCDSPDAPNACWPDYRKKGGFRKRKSRKKRRKKKHKTRKRKKSRRRR